MEALGQWSLALTTFNPLQGLKFWWSNGCAERREKELKHWLCGPAEGNLEQVYLTLWFSFVLCKMDDEDVTSLLLGLHEMTRVSTESSDKHTVSTVTLQLQAFLIKSCHAL